jgi:hypothetical protein
MTTGREQFRPFLLERDTNDLMDVRGLFRVV